MMNEELFSLSASGMIAEIDMRSTLASGDHMALAAWSQRGGAIRRHMRAMHAAIVDADGASSAELDVARSVLIGLGTTWVDISDRVHSA